MNGREPPRLMLSQTSSTVFGSSSSSLGASTDEADVHGVEASTNKKQEQTATTRQDSSSGTDTKEQKHSAGPANHQPSETMRLQRPLLPSTSSSTSAPRAEPWMQQAWVVHFLIGAAVLLYSVFWGNGGRSKYIVVDPSHANGMMDYDNCDRLFINVLASSPEEDGAVVCCSSSSMSATNETLSAMSSLLELCPPQFQPQHSTQQSFFPLSSLPFMGRLSKFPDAWLIPLFPLLLRIAFRTYQTILEKGHVVLDTTFGVYSFRRLVFYFLLMQFRGWVLYVALNSLEDNYYYGNNGTINSHDPAANSSSATCWYRDWLSVSSTQQQSSCRGRVFDFSDHVVLYYAQILPIALLEYLHSMNRPYW
eukprot:CAMPEP_0172456364 /NCGR_PEP_ID=MMETSP1065-20121228/15416_1 /TAXON_ID=265537 /ORGANISM="Amphiprora paludosa, Strain CCMP125" /LENGTH=363 /DNA_ID=CAMNT_0013209313 /DNA_START=389 /DNA_END=1477 /DNA_ORIENTATION=+